MSEDNTTYTPIPNTDHWKTDDILEIIDKVHKSGNNLIERKEFGKIQYAIDFGATRIFFAEKGITYSFLETKKIPRAERENLAN